MSLIHYVVNGSGSPPFVLVHGFACDHTDYASQTAELAKRHRVVAVDLRGHGKSKGTPDECSIERYGADVAEVMHALDLAPAILVGHSMGCRVVLEAALQAPSRAAGLILVDGSQFSPTMEPVLKERFGAGAFTDVVGGMFRDMFTSKSDPAIARDVVARAQRLPAEIGAKVLLDLLRYDITRLETTLSGTKLPLMAIQTTFSNEKRERSTMRKGQMTPYLDTLRKKVPQSVIEIIPDTGHFPQLDEPNATTRLLSSFADRLS